MRTSGEFVDFIKRNAREPALVEVMCTRWGRKTAFPDHFTLRYGGRLSLNVPHGEIPDQTIWQGPVPVRQGWRELVAKFHATGYLLETPEVEKELQRV